MTLPTWAGKSKFSYSGSVLNGTEIRYGNGWKASVSAGQYSALIRHFSKREISIGTSRTVRSQQSLGQWLVVNVTKTAIASYVGPILVSEGYAVVGSEPDRIKFL